MKSELGASAAARVESSLTNFLAFVGDIPIHKITSEALAAYQRARLAGPVRQRKPPKQIRALKDPKVIADWIAAHPMPAASRSSMAKERSHITRLLRRHSITAEWPKIGLATETTGRAFTPKELESFFKHCTPDYTCLYALMLATGARPAELIPSIRSAHVPLLKSEIDFKAATVTIRTAKRQQGRARKSRTVTIPEALIPLLRGQIQSHIGETVFHFQSNLARNFSSILKRAGIAKHNALGEKLTAHSFRHTHATLLSAQGESPFAVQSALGHSQIATTARYVHAPGAKLQLDLASLIGHANTGAEIIKEKKA